MRKIILILLLLTVILLLGCQKKEVPDTPKVDTEDNQQNVEQKECQTNSDCAKGGCSSQVCTTKEKAESLITTCEFRPEYGCYQQAVCGCVDGKCQFVEDQSLISCLNDVKKQ